ncbi:MAG: PQQ-dependent sugar dehydrogenase [Nitrospirota bacterium]|nr:PQQ-dependent sugar dehydrogenase [Nitrospirota bacterium]
MRTAILIAVLLSLLTVCVNPALAARKNSDPAPARTTDAPPPTKVADGAPVALDLVPVGNGFKKPLFLTHSGTGDGQLFVVEQTGQVRILDPRGGSSHKLFADLGPLAGKGVGERGLLGMAFHPQFSANGQFYVYFTDPRGNIVVGELRVTPKNPDRADPATFRPLLSIDNPQPNHNGGMLAFGPDGRLYIGVGDGGASGDLYENAQNTYSLLGKILRIGVEGDKKRAYTVPDDNPFLRRTVYRPEIWALGLRNPWRFSFDRASGDMFIADVGEDNWEEINYVPADAASGQDFGWNVMEGTHCFPPGSEFRETKRGLKRTKQCDRGTLPVAEYSHDAGCSVIGGYVYRGTAIPRLTGAYLFSDLCSGVLTALIPRDGDPGNFSMRALLQTGLRVSSFGEGGDGELYLLDNKAGAVYRIVPRP